MNEMTNGIVNIIDDYLLKEHNRIAKEFFDAGVEAGKEAGKDEIMQILNDLTYHQLEYQTITLRAGEPMQHIKMHSPDCGACYALGVLYRFVKGI